jgi:hypothetical protein
MLSDVGTEPPIENFERFGRPLRDPNEVDSSDPRDGPGERRVVDLAVIVGIRDALAAENRGLVISAPGVDEVGIAEQFGRRPAKMLPEVHERLERSLQRIPDEGRRAVWDR